MLGFADEGHALPLGSGLLPVRKAPVPRAHTAPERRALVLGVGGRELRTYVFPFWASEMLTVESQEVPAQTPLPPRAAGPGHVGPHLHRA